MLPISNAPSLETSRIIRSSFCCLTTAKVKKIALSLFAGLVFFFGLSMLAFTLTNAIIQSTFLALPFFLAGGGLILVIKRIKDYNDPITIGQFRLKASQKSLLETEKQHGWNNMFYYGIPDPKDFPTVYRQTVKSMTLTESIHFYKMVKEAKENVTTELEFEIPPPKELKTKWIQETQNKTILTIIEQYDSHFDEIKKYKIITDKEWKKIEAIKKKYQNIRHDFQKHLNQVEKKFSKKITPAAKKFHKVLLAEKNKIRDFDQQNWILRIEKEIIANYNNPKKRIEWEAHQALLKKDLSTIFCDIEETIIEAHKKFKTSIAPCEKWREKKLNKVSNWLNEQIQKIDCSYNDAINPQFTHRE